MKFQVWSMLAVIILMLSLATAKPTPGKSRPDARIEAQQRLQQQIEKVFGEEEWFEVLNSFISEFVEQEEEALKSQSKSTPSPGSKTTPPSASHHVTHKTKKPVAPETSTKKTMSKPEKETTSKAEKPSTAKEVKTMPPKPAKPTTPLSVKSGAKRTVA
ncbi:hypothetical protein GHT06_010894 [Daphnia sinensis]|uniref:Uncharacterized protein n=1 Tax=Daphnia sinensis TaxID=1820382 RepID=A0AAD5PXC8_9CRUS|nr:hypothetical protein GHT06_010894 [Daphnia sinensis]